MTRDFRFGRIAILLKNFLEIPATDLNVAFRIAQQAGRTLIHLPFQLVHAGFRGPLAADCRRDLHQPDFAVFAIFPRTEISLFVNNAPNQIGIEPVNGGLPARSERRNDESNTG